MVLTRGIDSWRPRLPRLMRKPAAPRERRSFSPQLRDAELNGEALVELLRLEEVDLFRLDGEGRLAVHEKAGSPLGAQQSARAAAEASEVAERCAARGSQIGNYLSCREVVAIGRAARAAELSIGAEDGADIHADLLTISEKA